MKKTSNRRIHALTAAAVCIVMLLSQVFSYAAYNTVPSKNYPRMSGVELETENVTEPWETEIHIKFTNNVSAIDETQERNPENEPGISDPDYMIGVNERNLTKFHLLEADTQMEVDSSVEWEVKPHPQAKKQADSSKFFYVYAKGLAPDKNYQILVDEDLYANMGNSLGVAYIIDFNTGNRTISFHSQGDAPEDEHVQAPLTLDVINIENNQKNVSCDVKIVMRFSYNVAGEEVLAYNSEQISMVVASDKTQSMGLNVQKGGEMQELIVTPKESLKPGTEYRLIINKTFVARNGITLSSPLNIYFTTEEITDENHDSGSGGGTSDTGDNGDHGNTDPGDDESDDDNNSAKDSRITVIKHENGTVTIDPQNAGSGDTVTMTITPESGYTADTIRVISSEGKAISLTRSSSDTYSFTMPDGNIEVDVTFKKDVPSVLYFSDLEDNWAADDINELADQGIVTGSPDGSFQPDRRITRAEIVTILVRMYDLDSEEVVSFADSRDHWAAGYISIAAGLGYVNGYDQDHFGPDDSLTREQMAALAVRIAELEEDTSPDAVSPSFTDGETISDWAKSAVRTMYQNQIINGYPDGSFRPVASITRAEACHIIAGLLHRQDQAA